jgi:hypothetical protein
MSADFDEKIICRKCGMEISLKSLPYNTQINIKLHKAGLFQHVRNDEFFCPSCGTKHLIKKGWRGIDIFEPMKLNEKCAFCSNVEYIPFQCSVCEKYYCSEHRLPESHGCKKDW